MDAREGVAEELPGEERGVMTPERHAQVKQLFLAAIEVPEAERGPWLEKKCGDDAALRREIDLLLAQQSIRSHHTVQGHSASGAGDGMMAPVASNSSAPSGELVDVVIAGRPPGTIIAGRHRIVSRLGAGGMGVVYQAEDLTLNQKVAIKFLPRAVAQNPVWLARFRNEARLARSVTHPNICRVHDIGEAEGEYFLTMEFVPGESLAGLLRQIGRFPSEKAVSIACQVCAGLAAAHRAGVLHRDLKPANIMLDAGGSARITDFGIAGLSDQIAAADIRAGTPAYMAPEQISGRDVTMESDIYALGLVLYELFSGCRGFQATSVEEYQQLHENSMPRPLSEIVSDLPEGIEEIIGQCLQKDPDDRPRSALHVAAALPGTDVLRLALAANLTPPPDLIAAAPARTAGTGYRLWVAGGAMLLLISMTIFRSAYPIQWDNLGAIPPAALAERARVLLESAGLSIAHAHEAFGYSPTEEAWRPLARSFAGKEVAQSIVAVAPSEPCFFYRQSDRPFVPNTTENVFWRAGYTTPEDPPPGEGHSRAVVFEKAGRFLLMGASAPAGRAKLDSTLDDRNAQERERLLRAVGVAADQSDLGEVNHQNVKGNNACAYYEVDPPVQTDRSASLAVACSSGQGPTFVALGTLPTAQPPGEAIEFGVFAIQKHFVIYAQRVLFLLLMAFAIPLGIAKSRGKKTDYRGPVRLAVLVALLEVVATMLRLGNAASLFDAVTQLAMAVVRSAGIGGLLGVSFLAIDSYARRLWPHLLITWNRLVLGRIGDADVRFHTLVGACVGCWWACVAAGERTVASLAGLDVRPMFGGDFMAEKLHGPASVVAAYLGCVEQALVYGLLFLLLLIVVRSWIRHPVWAGVACALILSLILVPRGANSYTAWIALGLGGAAVCVWIMMRYGLLTIVVALLVAMILTTTPMNIDTHVWTTRLTISALLITLALIAFGSLGHAGTRAKFPYTNPQSV